MKVAPLIYSRTYFCDFNAKFLVCPNDLDGFVIAEMKKYVDDAIRNIDDMKGRKYVVFSAGNHRVFGVVAKVRDLLCGLSGEVECQKSESLYVDERGRSIFAFVGAVSHCDKIEPHFVIENKLLAKLFYDNVIGVWYEKNLPRVIGEYEELTTGQVDKSNFDEVEKLLKESKFLEQSEEGDKKIFKYFCQGHVTNSFCSNMDFYADVKRTCFDVVTTSHNVIERMKSDTQRQQEKFMVKWGELGADELIGDMKERYGLGNYKKVEESILEQPINISLGTIIQFEGKTYKVVKEPKRSQCWCRGFTKKSGEDSLTIEIVVERC